MYSILNEGISKLDSAYISFVQVITDVLPYSIIHIEEIREAVISDLGMNLLILVGMVVAIFFELTKRGRESNG